MSDPLAIPEAMIDHTQRVLFGAVRKLREAMDEGPFAPPISLSTEEACLLWRTLDIFAPNVVESAMAAPNRINRETPHG